MVNTVDKALGIVVRELSDQNYTQSLASYRFWFDIGETHYQNHPAQIFDIIWDNRTSSTLNPGSGQLIHSTAHLVLRFAHDAESDLIPASHASGLQSRLCERSLREFFSKNIETVWSGNPTSHFHADVNLIAHWINLGYVEESVIRNHILQSLISHSALWDHQAEALIILFKLAGPTFEAYADPSVIDCCFQLLNKYRSWLSKCSSRDIAMMGPIKVRTPHPVKGGHWAEANLQELLALRERGWEGLPPPPVFTTEKPKLTSENQKDPAATPVVTSLGLPNRDLEPQTLSESVTAPEKDAIPASPVTPATQSPSISIAALSDFTIADTSDDESSIEPTIPDTSDDEPPVDPTAVTSHGTFYLEDGNVEVLCGNALFRVHTTVLSFHSPALRRMFGQTILAAAESPNGCPRILSSDTAKDFATLLKIVYLPESVVLPA